MAIFDEVLRGIIPLQNNTALNNMAKILGNKLVTGQPDANTPILSFISGSLLPIWIGLLFLVLAYIGISGVIRSAQDGQVLGKQWNSFKVPMGFIVGVILLAPIPNYNGVVVAQYAFVKSAIFGSNLADFTLKKIFEAYNVQQVEKKFGVKDRHVQQVNNQMKRALNQYYCAEQLTAMGYGSRVDYYYMLQNVCGILVNNAKLYKTFYLNTDGGHLNSVNSTLGNLSRQYEGGTLPQFNPDSATENFVNQSINSNNPAARELDCYFDSFRQHLSNQLPNDLAAKFYLTREAPIQGIGARPTQINNRDLTINGDALNAAWANALHQSYTCVRSSVAQNAVDEVSITIPPEQTPWRRGWVHAAQSIQDDLSTYALAEKAGQMPLPDSLISETNPRKMEQTLEDRRNQEILTKNLLLLNNLLYGTENKTDAVASTYGSVLNMPDLSGITPTDRTITTLLGMGFVATTPTTTYAAIKAEVEAAKAANRVADLSTKQQALHKFMSSVLGQTVAVPARVLEGSYTKMMAMFFSKANKLLANSKKADSAISSVMNVFGPLGKAAKGIYDVGKSVILPDPIVISILGYTLIAMNVIIIAPELILLIVMLLWLMRLTILFMVIPLAVVIIAIPDTRAGHDIWKSCLATALVPFLALCFYLISYVVTDIMYASVATWVFDPILNNTGVLDGVKNFILTVISGEIFFRLIAGCLVVFGASMLLWLMILRGPDYVSRLLHLNSTSGDLGGELEQEFSHMRGGITGSFRRGG